MRRARTLAAAALLLAGAALVPACRSGDEGEVLSCGTGFTCADGFLCVAGACLAPDVAGEDGAVDGADDAANPPAAAPDTAPDTGTDLPVGG